MFACFFLSEIVFGPKRTVVLDFGSLSCLADCFLLFEVILALTSFLVIPSANVGAEVNGDPLSIVYHNWYLNSRKPWSSTHLFP